jgi:hypothetical protein
VVDADARLAAAGRGADVVASQGIDRGQRILMGDLHPALGVIDAVPLIEDVQPRDQGCVHHLLDGAFRVDDFELLHLVTVEHDLLGHG